MFASVMSAALEDTVSRLSIASVDLRGHVARVHGRAVGVVGSLAGAAQHARVAAGLDRRREARPAYCHVPGVNPCGSEPRRIPPSLSSAPRLGHAAHHLEDVVARYGLRLRRQLRQVLVRAPCRPARPSRAASACPSSSPRRRTPPSPGRRSSRRRACGRRRASASSPRSARRTA